MGAVPELLDLPALVRHYVARALRFTAVEEFAVEQVAFSWRASANGITPGETPPQLPA